MPIKVLLADDSQIMNKAVARLLNEDPHVELVGIAADFAQMMKMSTDFNPELILMDLHLPEKREFTPDLVKSQLAAIPTIAISISNDDEARGLARSYGALTLLDKMNLFDELVPTILKLAPHPVHSPRSTPSASSTLSRAKCA